MKKKLLFIGAAILAVLSVYLITTKESTSDKVRKQHKAFLENHEYNKTMNLSRKERKLRGIPPNAYAEQNYLNEISPITGKTYPMNVYNLRKEIQENKLLGRVPGEDTNPWEERGPDNIGGRVRAAMFDPNDATNETVFAGGVNGGLWKNTKISDPNQVWERVDIPDNLAISSITVDPNNSQIFYLGTGESYIGGSTGASVGDGVWKSTDGGNTWARVFGGRTGVSYFQNASNITINSPSSIANNYSSVPTNNFGTEVTSIITSDIVLVNDGTSDPTKACSTLTNTAQVNGKIALIRRGDCNFTAKVKNAQNAGAIAVIMMNNVSGDPIPMGGSDPLITIPAVMISKAHGDLIEQEINNGNTVNGSLNPQEAPFTGVVIPGPQHVNDVEVRNNNGTTEIYVAVSDASYGPSNTMTVNSSFSYGLYKSSDGGTSWTKLTLPYVADINSPAPNDIEIGSDGKIWVATTNSVTYRNGGGLIYVSSDGITFVEKYRVLNGARTQIAISKTNANKIYVLAQLTSGGKVTILKTINGFSSVQTLPLPNDADPNITANDFTRGQAYYDLMLNISPNNDENIFVGGIDLFGSSNGGSSWQQLSHWYGGFGYQYVHADQHIAVFANGNSNKIIFGNDGGIYYSNNGGATISSRNKGLNITQFYTVGVSPTSTFSNGEKYIVGGTQDNGSLLLSNVSAGVNGASEVQSGDGAYSFFDQSGDKYHIANYVFNRAITLYNLENNQTVTINSENSNIGSFINECELDSNLDILYANYSSGSNATIRRYSGIKSASTLTKTLLTNDLLNSSPRALKVSPYTTTSSTLLVGTALGDVLKVENADTNPTWTEISGSDFVGAVSDIEYGATENEIFVTMHNYNVVNIWYTADGGQNWVNKEGNLPDIPVKAILQNPLNTQEVIIGTDVGIWKTSNFNDASPTWSHSYNGMSNAKVLDLDLRDDNTVFAATHGRGIFSGKFTSESASVSDIVSNEKEFTVYPTVSNGSFTIIAKNNLGKTQIAIYNLNGQEVYKSNIDFTFKEKQPVSVNLKSGVYILNLLGENNQKLNRKIVIE